MNQKIQSAKKSIARSQPSVSEHVNTLLPTVPKFRIDSAHLRERDPMRLPAGEMYGDFFIRDELGRGAFGVVYLAEQLSLKRTVALKVTDSTRDSGCEAEGQTMAQLEHPSIVRVYSQSTDEVNKRRLLCLQYVPGMNLRSLITKTRQKYRDDWQGKHLLDILDRQADQEDLVVRETSLADREFLMQCDKLAAVCWIGAEAAFALDHAHRAGYIHRDVKPANTIIDRFGRPMLVDFNLAMDSQIPGSAIVGGTVPYMSPESIKAFASKERDSASWAFDADIYALGIMLWELATGRMPFKSVDVQGGFDDETIQYILDSRRERPRHGQKLSPSLAGALRRAFHYQADSRFSSASEFGETLRGVARQSQVLQSRETDGWLGHSVVRRPVLWLVIATILPHVVASGLQIAYNQAQIVSLLTEPAKDLFFWLLFWFNPIAYGICTLVAVGILIRVLRPWYDVKQGGSPGESEAETARQELLLIPKRFAIIGAFGWLGGAVVFPGIIYSLHPERFSIDVWLHFTCSFAISCAIAVTFSYVLSMAVIVYGMYPGFFSSPFRFAKTAAEQLGPLRSKWATYSVFAGLIPLAAAVLVVANFDLEQFTSVDGEQRVFAFKGLVVGLILASTIGFGLVRKTGSAAIRLINLCIEGSQ